MSRHICVAGDGAWGTALAHAAQRAGNTVSVWSRKTPDPLLAARADAVILAVPAQSVRDVLKDADITTGTVIVAAKGIERSTGLMLADVVRARAPSADIMMLSGPSFATDVMKCLPTAVVLAASTMTLAEHWARVLTTPGFRIYQSDDVLGVEVGGALKNVLAIACGIADGKGFGESARAALVTRGFAEMHRLGRKLGAKHETLMGLSGLGDLMLTCSSSQSRNFTFGRALGQGMGVAAALAMARGVVEGAATAAVAADLAARHGVDVPITRAVKVIIDDGQAPDAVIRGLLARPATSEFQQE